MSGSMPTTPVPPGSQERGSRLGGYIRWISNSGPVRISRVAQFARTGLCTCERFGPKCADRQIYDIAASGDGGWPSARPPDPAEAREWLLHIPPPQPGARLLP